MAVRPPTAPHSITPNFAWSSRCSGDPGPACHTACNEKASVSELLPDTSCLVFAHPSRFRYVASATRGGRLDARHRRRQDTSSPLLSPRVIRAGSSRTCHARAAPGRRLPGSGRSGRESWALKRRSMTLNALRLSGSPLCQARGLDGLECAGALVAVKVVRPVGRSTLTAPARLRRRLAVEAASGYARTGAGGSVGFAGPGSG